MIERGDGAARDDSELGRERGYRDEAEIGASGEQVICAARRKSVVDVVSLGECGVAWRVFEVPHERCGIEEVDGGDAEAI